MFVKFWGFLMASLAGIFFATAAFPAATFVPEVDEDLEELPTFLIVSTATDHALMDARICNWDPYGSKWVIEAWDHSGTKVFRPDQITIWNVDGAKVFIKNNRPFAELHQVRLNRPDRVKVVPIVSVIPGVVRIDDGTITALLEKNGFEY